MKRKISGFGVVLLYAAEVQDIRDVRPPVAFPPRLIPALFLLLAVVTVTVVYWIYRHRKKIFQRRPQPLPMKTPAQKACDRLEALLRGNLILQGEWEEFYLELSDIVRRYFEEQFSIRAPEMTSEEFLVSLKASPELTDPQKTVLKEFLDSCDIVKFARYAPRDQDARRNLETARRLIDETRRDTPTGKPDGI